MRDAIPAPSGGEFDYLLRKPRQARRLRRMLHIAIGFVALSAIGVLYGCAW